MDQPQNYQKSDKVVYFVRHGQSVDNTAPVFQSDFTPLSELGIRQALTSAERLSHLPFESLISSPLLRAKQTTGFIADKTGKQPEFNDLFVERIKPRATDGKPWGDKETESLFLAWKQTFLSHGDRVADGENYDDMVARADKAIDFLTARAEQSIVVVTHGIFLTTIVARVLAGDELTPLMLQRFHSRSRLENTSITAIRYLHDKHEDAYAWRLWTFNDHSHFAE